YGYFVKSFISFKNLIYPVILRVGWWRHFGFSTNLQDSIMHVKFPGEVMVIIPCLDDSTTALPRRWDPSPKVGLAFIQLTDTVSLGECPLALNWVIFPFLNKKIPKRMAVPLNTQGDLTHVVDE
ncbi:hypothetical protein L0F63_001032, partial [Massospora cicadina]